MARKTFMLSSATLDLKIRYCYLRYTKIIGLMFSPILTKNMALLIPSESACIHTFFMRFPIDVFWLDKDFRVVDLERNVRPWRPLAGPRKRAAYILEVPSRYEYKINVGDKFRMKTKSFQMI